MQTLSASKLVIARSIEDAVLALSDDEADAVPIAGGTWIMRAPIRNEAPRKSYVAIGQIAELRTVDLDEQEVRIGACVTHCELARALADVRQCRGLVAAANGAANPAIRQMATVGGNLATREFAASDLIPALLALDADVELANSFSRERCSIDSFLKLRSDRSFRALLTRVIIPLRRTRTAHVRLPLRKAGDYPVAVVDVAVDLDDEGRVNDVRIAVGSVEATARRWTDLEARLAGGVLNADVARELAEIETATFAGRESVEVPAWYRVQVLPVLIQRAVETILADPS